MTKQQIAILASLGLAVLCVLCFGVYIVVSEESAYRASEAITSPIPQVATEPITEPPTPAPEPTDTSTPMDTPVSPKPTSAPVAVPTEPAAPSASNVQITFMFYDGDVRQVESDEYVEITNLGSAPQDLAGWRLVDIADGGPSFIFPSYVLHPGHSVRVYTNEIHSEWGDFSFGSGRAIWNNQDPDVAALYDAAGNEVSRKSY